ncbi:MAG: alpha-galactosidase [Prevotella sp.]|nr:alpha-galactosidase [Prevotella sp.]
MKSLFLLVLTLLPLQSFAQHTPVMGWSSWNTYASQISEKTIETQADAMVDFGYQKAGYRYINIDDGFQGGRDYTTGQLLIHPTRFPNGLRTVVDYIHSKGLKAGIYSDAGRNTCANFYGGDKLSVDVGMYEYDQRDATLYFDSLDFDFIKVDFCGGTSWQNTNQLDLDPQERYTAIANAIANCKKKDIAYNVCRWDYPGNWVHDIASSWRISQDINASWNSVKDIIGQNLYLSAYCYGGHFNDMDMLEVGRGLSAEEDKTHFGMWCMMSSPLLIGCDMTKTSDAARSLMQNDELIALNQDSLALQAYVAARQGDTYVLTKDLGVLNGTTRAVALYNPTDAEVRMTLNFGDVDLGGNVAVRDLYDHLDLSTMQGSMNVTVPAHSTRIYRLVAEKRYERNLYEAETAYLSRYQELLNNQSYISGTYDDLSSASGGKIVGWLGNRADNDLLWKHVYSREGGDYQLSLSYISGENRKTIVTVNGQQVLSQDLNSGGWSAIKTVTFNTTLQPGDNVVRIYTDAGNWLPNIDCLQVVKVGSMDVYEKQLSSLRSQLGNIVEQPLTPAVRQLISAQLQSPIPDGMDENGYQTRIDSLQTLLSVAQAMTTSCAEMEKWMQNVRSNIAVSDDTEELSILSSKADADQQIYDAATSAAQVNTVLSDLKAALKTYLKAPGSRPKDGEVLDMTLLLVNPDFSLTTGWTGAPTYKYGVGECWNRNFNISQTLYGMKPGVYTVSVKALYRTGVNDGGAAFQAGTEVIPARFYANGDSTAIASLYSYTFPNAANYGTIDVKNGFANSMQTASQAFVANAYRNEVTTTLSETGMLKIGLVTLTHANDSWACFDDFQITYRPLSSTDAIRTPMARPDISSKIYDLTGKIVENMRQPGIYIVNGQRVIVK